LKRGLKKAFLPGRFEIVTENPHLILDGAHNPAGARVFTDAIHDYFKGVKGVVVAGFMGEKDVRGIITELARVSSKLIITRPLQERAFDPEEKIGYIRDMVEKFGITVIPDIPSAIRKGIDESRGCSFLAVTGSLYLVGEARAFLKGRR